MFSSIRSDLSWDTSARGYVFSNMTAVPTNNDVITGANLDYNGKYNVATGAGNTINGSAGQSLDGYQNLKITASPGAHDVTGDPQFVDKTRNLATWGQITQGADGTVAGALAKIAANPALIYSASDGTTLIPWVRAGFTPTNTAYRGTAHDAGDIGAVTMARGATHPGANGRTGDGYLNGRVNG